MTGRGSPATAARRLVAALRRRGIRSEAVLAAIARVPRQEFVPEPIRFRAWEDASLPIGRGQTISQPWIVARMCELAGEIADRRVLEIGTGSGYHAAVLAELGAIVFSVERHAALARRAARTLRRLGYLRVSVKQFDGTYGWAAEAPYAAIITTAAGPEIPEPLVRQLAAGGRLVLPLAEGSRQRLVVVTRRADGRVVREDCGPASFVPLIGRFGYDRGAGGGHRGRGERF